MSSTSLDYSFFSLQSRLVETRKVYPPLLKELYQRVRSAYSKLLRDTNTDVGENEFPVIPENLHQICDYDYQDDAINDQLTEQVRIMIILSQKQNCEISKIIDAI